MDDVEHIKTSIAERKDFTARLEVYLARLYALQAARRNGVDKEDIAV
jgi:hypothetical protein